MRQHVTPQELDEHFTVLPQEHTLLAQKSPVQRLGCAILLKYFQMGRPIPDRVARRSTCRDPARG